MLRADATWRHIFQAPGFFELPGTDHIFYVGENADEISDAIEEFLTGSRAPVSVDRVLATVLFTDIVGSTEKAAALGRSTLARSSRQSPRHDPAQSRAFSRPRSENNWRRISRYL